MIKKTLKHTYNFFLHAFALAGLVLVGGFFAIRFHLTDVKGAVDGNSQNFSKMVLGTESIKNVAKADSFKTDSTEFLNKQIEDLAKIKELRLKNICAIDAIGYYSPINAKNILATFESTKSDIIVSKMIFAATLRLSEAGRDEEIKKCDDKSNLQNELNDYTALEKKYTDAIGKNVFPWMNDDQWQTIKTAIARDRELLQLLALNRA